MIFHLKFDQPDDATAFLVWCEETGVQAQDTYRGGCPYRPGMILEARVADAATRSPTWAAMIVGFGTR